MVEPAFEYEIRTKGMAEGFPEPVTNVGVVCLVHPHTAVIKDPNAT